MKLETLTLEVVKLAKEVGNYIRNQRDKISVSDVENKGLHDLVTFVDKESENRIVQRLSKLFAEAGFIAEENQALKRKSDYNWIIDPLDGTTNFIHGIPVFSVSIALANKEEIILGVIYEINQDECFYAWKGGGAYLNSKQIYVSTTAKLNDSLLATGFPYSDYALLKPYLELFEDLMKSTRGIRRLGSAAADMAYLACGRFDVFYEYGLSSWDIAAGIIIVIEAGGNVSDFNNEDNFLFGRQMIASNSIVHQEFLKHLQQYFTQYL